MRWLCSLVLIGMLAIPAAASGQSGNPAEAATVRAATAKAIATLYGDVARAPLASGLTVGQFLDRAGGRDQVVSMLHGAEQIGGPRWIDEKTCQIQLEVSGQRVAWVLRQIAAANPRTSPVSPAQLDAGLSAISRRTFSATASAAAPGALESIRPRLTNQQWEQVPPEMRRQALAAAADDAARRMLASVEAAPAGPGQTLGQMLAVPAVRRQAMEWIQSRPVDRVEFGQDLRVAVTLAADPRDFFSAIRAAAEQAQAAGRPADDAAWRQAEAEFVRRLAPAVGQAVVVDDSLTPVHTVVQLPKVAPDWTAQRIEVEGVAQPGPSKLRAARQAELAARDKLRGKLEELTLDKGKTIGEAARKSPRVASAVSRAVANARISRTTYLTEGGASVWVWMDLGELWAALHR